MIARIVAGSIAALLVLAYLLPPALKLKDAALGVVIGIGIAMMLIDLYQSARKND